jgi:hypothetical protein
MATDAAGPTPPEPARPLSEQERGALEEIEAANRREDPDWYARLAGKEPPAPQTAPAPRASRGSSPQGPGARVRNLVIQVVVVGVLAMVLMPNPWLGALLVVIVMIGPVGVALWAMRRGVL